MAATSFPVAEMILDRLQRVKSTGSDKWQACCPAHEDRQASLSVSRGDKGLLLKCFAGCSCQQICDALNIKPADLFYEQRQNASRRRIVAEYDYTDARGNLLYQVVRYDPKDFRQRRPDGNGGWEYSLKGTERVLYRLPEVLEAVKRNETIFLPEGEKDCDNLCALGLTASTNAQGASQPFLPAYAEALHGADVVILPDADNAGRDCRDIRIKALLKTARRIRILDLPGLAAHGDVTDWINAGGTKEELLHLVNEHARDASPLNPEMQPVLAGLQEALRGLPITVEANGLPTLAEGASVGDVGQAIRRAVMFGRKTSTVVNLFVGALGHMAGGVKGAQKQWAERIFGKDESLYTHFRQCVLVYRQWAGIFDPNQHEANWSSMLLGARKIFSPEDRREFVQRPKMPTGPQITAEITRRQAEQNGGVIPEKPLQTFGSVYKLLVKKQGQEYANTLLHECISRLSLELLPDEGEDERNSTGEPQGEATEEQQTDIADADAETPVAVSILEADISGASCCDRIIRNPLTYTHTQPQQEAPSVCCEITTDAEPTRPMPALDPQQLASQRLVKSAFARQESNADAQEEAERTAARWKQIGIQEPQADAPPVPDDMPDDLNDGPFSDDAPPAADPSPPNPKPRPSAALMQMILQHLPMDRGIMPGPIIYELRDCYDGDTVMEGLRCLVQQGKVSRTKGKRDVLDTYRRE